jgi:hypothetical protein
MSANTTEANTHPIEAFFGPYQGTNEKLRADDRLAHETYNLPDAYKGKNKFLESVLDFKIRKEDEFYTSKLLPWSYTDELHVAWEIFSFNRTLADLEPHQGVPRYVSAQSEAHTDNLLRRGLAFIIEHGFYKTERGKRHFALNLQQISDAVHTTCYFGVIHSLLSGQNYYKEWNRRFGRQVNRVNDLMAAEKRRWAIVQKEENGLYILDAELKHELKREGVTPNLWVFPDKMGIYVNMVGEHQVDYHKRGPEANDNRMHGDAKASFRGLPVFESQSFDVDFTGEPIDLMIREQQCGEYFYMKHNEDIVIYSADSDKFEQISFADAKAAAVNNGSTKTSAGHKNGMQPMAGSLGENYDILLFRPNQTYRMASAILAKGGSETGSSFHGNHDFQLSDDIIRKVHVGHYTFYSKAVVKQPKNYVLVENIFAQGYVGGEGIEFHDKTGTSFSRVIGGENLSKSLIAVKVPSGTSSKLKNVLDITGRFDSSIYESLSRLDSEGVEHYPFSGEVYAALGLSKYDNYRVKSDDEYLNRVKRVNTVCWRGMQLNLDGQPTQLNTGHWGENVYPGVRKVREGENSFMKNCDWNSKMSLGFTQNGADGADRGGRRDRRDRPDRPSRFGGGRSSGTIDEDTAEVLKPPRGRAKRTPVE